MKATELVDAAQAQGIVVEIFAASGRIHLGGKDGVRAGRLVRLFATLGIDAAKDENTTSVTTWKLSENGRHVGTIDALSNDLGSAFAFVSA